MKTETIGQLSRVRLDEIGVGENADESSEGETVS
jgi:hypothetical protein